MRKLNNQQPSSCLNNKSSNYPQSSINGADYDKAPPLVRALRKCRCFRCAALSSHLLPLDNSLITLT